jgi:hypothetical protein
MFGQGSAGLIQRTSIKRPPEPSYYPLEGYTLPVIPYKRFKICPDTVHYLGKPPERLDRSLSDSWRLENNRARAFGVGTAKISKTSVPFRIYFSDTTQSPIDLDPIDVGRSLLAGTSNKQVQNSNSGKTLDIEVRAVMGRLPVIVPC